MTKQEIENLNKEVLIALNEYNERNNLYTARNNRLRTCSATVYELVNSETGELEYILLRSYNTIVAFIDLERKTLFDVLRYVYGYTSTSAQHIAKFASDYRRFFTYMLTYR